MRTLALFLGGTPADCRRFTPTAVLKSVRDPLWTQTGEFSRAIRVE